MTRPTPTECWAAGVGAFVVVNGTAWRKGDDATLCASLIRPAIKALGPLGPPAAVAALVGFGWHLLEPIYRKARR